MYVNKKVMVAVLAVCASIMIAASPGTSADPLVAQSYVDDKIDQVLMLIASNGVESGTPVSKDEIVEEILLKLQEVNHSTEIPQANSSTEISLYQAISITTGQKVIGGEGTEMILRSGYAKVYSTVQNGVVNATRGIDMANGRNIDVNHLLIIPREGRGMQATSDCWLMVKGSYTIQ